MLSLLFYLPIGLLLVGIAAMILRAVKATNATIARSEIGRSSNPEELLRAIDRIRSRDVRCPRCGEQAFAMLGKDRRWMCEIDSCRLEFEGPQHLPSRAA